MRTQTLTSRFEDEVRLAGAVDPTGWLAPAPAADSDTDTPDPAERVRRAARRVARRSGGRAPGRVGARRRRVVGARSLTRLVPEAAAAAAPSPARSATGTAAPIEDGYRMGRWARLSLTVTVLATVVIVVVALTAGSASPRLVDVTVAPGDSLWSIATASAPDRDPRSVIEDIKQLNDVSGSVLPVGVVLRVPASGE